MTSIEKETEKLRQWLDDSRHNISAIAKATGIGRTTLYRFIKGDKPTLTVLSRLAREHEKNQDNGSKAA